MRYHIMLLLLSDVKADGKQPERVSMAKYKNVPEVCGVTNESAVRYLLLPKDGAEQVALDKIFLFATKKVQAPIHIAQPSPDVAPGVTHLAYFKERVKGIVPSLLEEEFFEVVSYDEDQPISETRRSVLEMAERIMAYAEAKKAQGDEVVLHADLTGGLRHAVMLMLAVMRLLQYNGIEIGKVLYSNYPAKIVEEANDIYSLFDLIAGADEFAQFGSVSAILRYFGYDKEMPEKPPHISERLHSLLSAMHGFAEEIKVCHYGALSHAVEKLSKALKAFREGREADGADINEGMIAQLRFRVEEEYKEILGEKIDDVKLLRWCVNHGYWQQALTLFTERVPEILKAREVLQLSPEFAAKVQAKRDKDDKRSEIFYLFADYKDEETKAIGDQVNAFFGKAKQAYRKIMKAMMCDVLKNKNAPSYEETDWDAQLFSALDKQPLLERWREKAMQSLALEDASKVKENYERFRAWCNDPGRFLTGKYEKDLLWEELLGALCEQEVGMDKAEESEKREALCKKWRETFDALKFGKKRSSE